MPIDPPKTHSPLIIDSDTVLPFAIAFERFESVAWRCHEVFKPAGLMKIKQLAASCALDGTKPGYQLVIEECLGIGGPKGLDHPKRVLRHA
jgi:hypothetical protein